DGFGRQELRQVQGIAIDLDEQVTKDASRSSRHPSLNLDGEITEVSRQVIKLRLPFRQDNSAFQSRQSFRQETIGEAYMLRFDFSTSERDGAGRSHQSKHGHRHPFHIAGRRQYT